MSGQDYGIPERAALFALMGIGREVSNPELQQIAGFSLTGKQLRRLNQDGLVTSRRLGRPYVHELTDKGWRWCTDELGAACPPRAGSGGGALYAVLAGLGRYLSRSDLRLADVFGRVPAFEPAPLLPDEPANLEDRVLAAYRSLARSRRDWVSLTQLRALLGDAAPDDVDAILRQMSRARRANLVPQSNQKVLTPADRAAAVRIGDQDNHLISIEEEL